MTFDKVLDDGRLWAVRFNKDNENALQKVLSQWQDAEWLADFFTQNMDDLISYFRITNIEDAIYQTMEDRDELACIIMDISPEANLDHFFRPLDICFLRSGQPYQHVEKNPPKNPPMIAILPRFGESL